MKHLAVIIGIGLILSVASCGHRPTSSYAHHHSVHQDGVRRFIFEFVRDERVYAAVWHMGPGGDYADPAFLLAARASAKARLSPSHPTAGHSFFEILVSNGTSRPEPWASYDVAVESAQDTIVIGDQSYDLADGRVFLLDARRVPHQVVQVDADCREMDLPKDAKQAFTMLLQEHHLVQEFLSPDQ